MKNNGTDLALDAEPVLHLPWKSVLKSIQPHFLKLILKTLFLPEADVSWIL